MGYLPRLLISPRNQKGVKGFLPDFHAFFADSLLNKWPSSVVIEPLFAFGFGRWASLLDRGRHAATLPSHAATAMKENRTPNVTYFRARVVSFRIDVPPPVQFRKMHLFLPLGWISLLTFLAAPDSKLENVDRNVRSFSSRNVSYSDPQMSSIYGAKLKSRRKNKRKKRTKTNAMCPVMCFL